MDDDNAPVDSVSCTDAPTQSIVPGMGFAGVFERIEGDIYHTLQLPGEDIWDAIVRAGIVATNRGLAGYSIDCSKCGRSLGECRAAKLHEEVRQLMQRAIDHAGDKA